MKTIPILPVEAYLSQQWFDKEQELIFSKTWQFAGFREELEAHGDYITVQAGLNNIIIIVDETGQLSAYHNMCKHRGAQLLRAVGNTKKIITCPYHDWSYNIDGKCCSIPNKKSEFPDVDIDSVKLKKASVAIWKSMIFVHPDENAESLESWLDVADEYTGPHHPENLYEYENTKEVTEIDANWKIVAENFMDVYHLSHLHSGTLNMYDHKKHKSGFIGNHFYFYEPMVEEYRKNLHKYSPYPPIGHIPMEKNGAYTPLIFPNLGLGESESSWSTFHIKPVSPEKTIVEVRSKFVATNNEYEFYDQAKSSDKFWSGKIRGKYGTDDENDPMESGNFMMEDKYACEQMQKSLKSPHFEVTHTAKHLEEAIRDFQSLIKKWMETGGEE